MSPAVEQGILRRMRKHQSVFTGVNKSHGVNRKNKEMTSKPLRKVMLTEKPKPVCPPSDSSGTTEQTLRSVSPRQINQIEMQNSSLKDKPFRYLGYPIETSVPFNRMLSTSTPDPDKCPTAAVNWADCVIVPPGYSSNTENKPERKVSKKPTKSHAASGHVRQHQTDAIPRNPNSTANTTNIKNNAIQPKEDAHIVAVNTQTSLGAGVSLSNPAYGNAYMFSVQQINKVSSSLNTNNNQSAFNSVVPLSKHRWQDTTNDPSNAKKVLSPVNQCIASPKVQKPVSENTPSAVPLTSTKSGVPNLDSRQVPTSCSDRQTTYYPDLLKYKLPDYSAKYMNNVELSSHLSRNQVPIQESLVCVPFSDKTVNNNVASHSKEHEPFTGHDIIKDTLQTSVSVSAPNHKTIPPVSSNLFSPINPSQGSIANIRVPFEEPVRDNDVEVHSTQLKQPKVISLCSNSLASVNSNHVENPLKELQGNTRNSSNDNPSPLEYILSENSKNHQNTSKVNCKENPYIHGCLGNNYNIHLQWQSVEALAGAKTLKFIVNELKETCKSTNHREITRMVNQLEDIVNTLPQLQHTFDLQTEFSLALQPLRSENNRLQKRLRTLAEEKTQMEKKMEEDHRREILELQLEILNWEKHVDEEKLQNQLLLHRHEHVIKDLKNQQQCLVKDIGKRDNSQLNLRLKNWEENQRLSDSVKEAEDQLARNAHVLELSEKKNHILQITVEQRDKEISNLFDVLHSLRKAMQEVLDNINPSNGNISTADTLEKFFELFPQEPECTGSVLDAHSDSRLSLGELQQVFSNVATGREESSNVTPKESTPEDSINQSLQALLKTKTANTSLSETSSIRSTSTLVSSSKYNQQPDVSVNDFDVPNSSVSIHRELTDPQNQLNSCQGKTEIPSALKDNDQQPRPDRDIFCLSDHLEHSFDFQNKVETGNDSRASISAYFQKYPRSKALNDFVGDDNSYHSSYMADRAQPFPFKSIQKNAENSSAAKEIQCDSGGKGKGGEVDYKDHDEDDDDKSLNLSQYTFNTDSSLNADIVNFRNGLASLDAGIAQLELSFKEKK